MNIQNGLGQLFWNLSNQISHKLFNLQVVLGLEQNSTKNTPKMDKIMSQVSVNHV